MREIPCCSSNRRHHDRVPILHTSRTKVGFVSAAAANFTPFGRTRTPSGWSAGPERPDLLLYSSIWTTRSGPVVPASHPLGSHRAETKRKSRSVRFGPSFRTTFQNNVTNEPTNRPHQQNKSFRNSFRKNQPSNCFGARPAPRNAICVNLLQLLTRLIKSSGTLPITPNVQSPSTSSPSFAWR